MAAMTVQAWPLWSSVRVAGAASWPHALATVRARAVAVAAADVELTAVARWATAVRLAGRIAVLRVPPERVGENWLRAVDGAPLVVALEPGSTTARRDWQNALAALARLRSPWLRLDLAQLPHCAVAALPQSVDVQIAWPDRPAGDDRCLRCAAIDRCPGPGGRRFSARPLPTPLSNQFDVEPAGPSPTTAIAVQGQPVLAISPGSAPSEAVARALAKGQLYVDRSDQPLVDDFAAQLQPLRRDRNGAWVPRREAPFAREEARLQALLADLRGVVVDVGAGPLRYVAALNAALEAGHLHYVAVEPDLDHLRAGQAAVPKGLFVRGVGEALPLRDGCADSVLLLRSWNHLRDVPAAVREATRVVRSGGLLIAVDNELFGLVRSAEQLARARAIDTAATPFEHYRNDTLDQAWSAIKRAAPGQWQRVQAWPVGPRTSNQWQLVARRSDG